MGGSSRSCTCGSTRSRATGSSGWSCSSPSTSTSRGRASRSCVREHPRRCHSTGRQCGTVSASPAAAPSPLLEDGIGLKLRETRRGTVHRRPVCAGDLPVDRPNALAYLVLAAGLPELLEGPADHGPDLERGRKDRDLLPLDKLLHPPIRIVRSIEAGDRLASAFEIIEGTFRAR